MLWVKTDVVIKGDHTEGFVRSLRAMDLFFSVCSAEGKWLACGYAQAFPAAVALVDREAWACVVLRFFFIIVILPRVWQERQESERLSSY